MGACNKDNRVPVIQLPESATTTKFNSGIAQIVDPVPYYSERFMNDSGFAIVLDKFIYSSMNMHSLIGIAGGEKAIQDHHDLINSYKSYSSVQEFYLNLSVDTASMLQYHVEPTAAYLYLWELNPDFAELSMEQQLSVIANIKSKLLDPSYRSSNPNNQLVKMITDFTTQINGRVTARASISIEDVVECAFGAIGGAVAGSYGLIRELWNVINGYNLGYSGIARVARSAFRTVVGGNVAGVAINFAFCIVGTSFF